VHHTAWQLFAHHHYLTPALASSAICFVGFIDGRPVAFHSYLPFVGRLPGSKAFRGHRSVVLPDFQGVGIGNQMITSLGSMWVGLGYRAFRNTGHPAEIAGARRDPAWRMTRAPKINPTGTNPAGQKMAHATNRVTASFEYIGPRMDRDTAAALLNREVAVAA
jgi:GNAT superfamily N-acetyltransferase